MPDDKPAQDIIRIAPEEMKATFLSILLKNGMSQAKSDICAGVFTDNSIDGVYTHGVNRFPRFIKSIRDKLVLVNAEPQMVSAFGAMEQWNGNQGAGPTNAFAATNRAVELSKMHGIGCVALANTNHWMRGGLYGWKAAKEGCLFIGWTNTIGNMPAWGAVDARLGNNPLVMALPHNNEAIVLDMAMSQYSFGALEQYRMRGQQLPVDGGYDTSGALTTDPAAILESKRVLPIGYWKGAGLSLLLDILATILSGGFSTATVTRNGTETSVSQVFISIDPSGLLNASTIAQTVNDIMDDYHRSIPASDKSRIIFPGERVMQTRSENIKNLIPVASAVWDEIIKT